MDPPEYNQINYPIYKLDLTDFLTNVCYKQQYFLNYKTISSFHNLPHNDDKVLIYDYGTLLDVDLHKYPQLVKYVVSAIMEHIPIDWIIKIDDQGHIYYENNSLSETSKMHPMTDYYTNIIKLKKKSIKKKKSCNIM